MHRHILAFGAIMRLNGNPKAGPTVPYAQIHPANIRINFIFGFFQFVFIEPYSLAAGTLIHSYTADFASRKRFFTVWTIHFNVLLSDS
jgi:hypothetical protein